jgi:hypothetical protein
MQVSSQLRALDAFSPDIKGLGPTVGLEAVKRRSISAAARNMALVFQPVAQSTYWLS